MSTLDLLPHNKQSYDKIAWNLQNGCKSIFYTAGTGTGKTYIVKALLDTYWFGCNVAYVVPTIAIQDYLMDLIVTLDTPVTMFTYDAFVNQNVIHRLLSEFDVVIFDEAHHLGSKIEGAAAVEFIRSFTGVCFGMTATPDREDNVDVSKFFDVWVHGISNYAAIQQGLMPPFEFYICNTKDALEVQKQYNLQIDIPNSWALLDSIRKARNFNRILAFYKNVSEMKNGAQDLRKLFPDYTVETLSYLTMDIKETIKILHRDKVILCSCDMLLEGLHVPEVDTIFLFRNVRATRVLQQILGRVCNIGRKSSPTVVDFSTSAAKLYIKIMTEDYNAVQHRAGKPRSQRPLKPMLKLPATYIEAFDIMSMLAALQGGPVCVMGREFSTLRAACRFYQISLEKILNAIPSVKSLDDAFRIYNCERFIVGEKTYYTLHSVCKEYKVPITEVQSAVAELGLPIYLVVSGFDVFPLTVNGITYANPRDLARQKGITVHELIKYRYAMDSYEKLVKDVAPKGEHRIFGKTYRKLGDFCIPLRIRVHDVEALAKELDTHVDLAAEEYCKRNKIVVVDRVFNTKNVLGAQLNITVLLTKYYCPSISTSNTVLMCLDPKNLRSQPIFYGKVRYANLEELCLDKDISLMDVLITYHNTTLSMSEAVVKVIEGNPMFKWCYDGKMFPSLHSCIWAYNIKLDTFNQFVMTHDVTLHQALDYFTIVKEKQ